MSQNKPLKKEEVQALPLGFTPTATGPNCKERATGGRRPHNNRKATPGRNFIMVPVKTTVQTKFGPVQKDTTSLRRISENIQKTHLRRSGAGRYQAPETIEFTPAKPVAAKTPKKSFLKRVTSLFSRKAS